MAKPAKAGDAKLWVYRLTTMTARPPKRKRDSISLPFSVRLMVYDNQVFLFSCFLSPHPQQPEHEQQFLTGDNR